MLFKLFSTFFRIGAFTFGGGYAMLPLIEREVVEKQKWISQETFLDLFAISQSLPGVFAINMAIFIGYQTKRHRGAWVAALGTALPSFIIIMLIALFFREVQYNPWVVSAMKGIRPAVVALIAAPVLNTWKAIKGSWKNVWIPVVAVIAVWYLQISPVWIILVAGVAGIVYTQWITSKLSAH